MNSKQSSIFVVWVSIVFFLQICMFVVAQQGTIIPFSDTDKQTILSTHNNLRQQLPAAVMPNLQWMDNLALWENNPQNCLFQHTTQAQRTNVAGFSYVGENLASSGSDLPISEFIAGWSAEKSSYTYGPMTVQIVNTAGHYTQEIWADTKYIGCTKISCGNVGDGGFIIACNYGPGGNYLGQYPYLLKSSNSNSTVQSTTSCDSVTTSCQGKQCGTVDNGCGTQISCGTCDSSLVCDEVNFVCVDRSSSANREQLNSSINSSDALSGGALAGIIVGAIVAFCAAMIVAGIAIAVAVIVAIKLKNRDSTKLGTVVGV